MVNCHNRSGRDKDVGFFTVPKIVRDQGETVEDLSIERRRRWLSAISRDKLTEVILRNDRVCSLHFVSGHPAASWDKFNVYWIPSLNLGHSKTASRNEDCQQREQQRAERAKSRRKRRYEEDTQVSVAKAAKLDEAGDSIKDISFKNSEETIKDSATFDVSAISSEFEGLSISIDYCTQTEGIGISTTCELGTQT